MNMDPPKRAVNSATIDIVLQSPNDTTATGGPPQGGEVIEVELDELNQPGNDTAVIGILRDGTCPLFYYLDFANACLNMRLIQQAENFLIAGQEMAKETPMLREKNESDYQCILTHLAHHYIELAATVNDPPGGPASHYRTERCTSTTADQLIMDATMLLNQSEAIDNLNVMTLVGKGIIMALKLDYQQAIRTYKYALNRDPECLAAQLGAANAMFSYPAESPDYKGALLAYQKVFAAKECPRIRMCIGMCYLHLNMINEARDVFERALQVDPDDVDALVQLAVMDTIKAKSSSDLDLSAEARSVLMGQANERLAKAFHINPRHPILCIQLASQCLTHGLFKKALIMARIAIKYGKRQSDPIRAEAYFLTGRAYQALGKFEKALARFQTAHALVPKSPLYAFSLGEMLAYSGVLDKGLSMFEFVLTTQPNSYETLKHVFRLHCRLDHREAAQATYDKCKALLLSYRLEELAESVKKKKVVESDYMVDVELLLGMARMYEVDNPASIKTALEYYQKALTAMARTSTPCPPQIHLNMGALTLCLLEDADSMDSAVKEALCQDARAHLENAIFDHTDASDSKLKSKERINLAFNRAKLLSLSGAEEACREALRQIIRDQPGYVDAYLALASSLIDSPSTVSSSNQLDPEARVILEEALAIQPDNINTLCILGRYELLDKNLKPARKYHELVLQKLDKYDIYSLVAVGNINLILGRVDTKQKAIHFKRAFEFFEKALKTDKRCVYAANGIGIALAENEDYASAKDVFSSLQDCGPLASLNLAHALMELGQTTNAIAIYERLLKKNHSISGTLDGDAKMAAALKREEVSLLQYLAKAHYIIGKGEKNPKSMKMSLTLISKAAALHPGELGLVFDLALVLQQLAQVYGETSREQRAATTHTVEDMREALLGVDESERIFRQLSENPKFPYPGFDVDRARERGEFAKNVRRQIERRIHEQDVFERQNAERVQEIRRAREAAQALKLQEEAERATAAAAEQQALEAKRLELQEKLRLDTERLKAKEEEMERKQAADRAERAAAKRATPHDSDEDAGDTTKRGRREKRDSKRPKKSREASPNESSASPPPTPRATGIRSNLSKAVIESDDDDAD